MKIKIIIATLLITIFAFVSCTKESSEPNTPKYQVEGLWIGTFTVDNNPSATGAYFYSYAVYPDGSILIKSLGSDGNHYYSTGSWILSNTNIFTATFTTINYAGPQVTQTITTNFSDEGNMTDGVWSDTNNGNQTGKLTMKKVID